MKCVGGKKEVFSVQKNDNLSFFSLGSQPVEMDPFQAVSLSVSQTVFFIVSQGLRGAMLQEQPRDLTLSPSLCPLRVASQLISQFLRCPDLETLEQKVKNVLCTFVIFPANPKNSCTKAEATTRCFQ